MSETRQESLLSFHSMLWITEMQHSKKNKWKFKKLKGMHWICKNQVRSVWRAYWALNSWSCVKSRGGKIEKLAVNVQGLVLWPTAVRLWVKVLLHVWSGRWPPSMCIFSLSKGRALKGQETQGCPRRRLEGGHITKAFRVHPKMATAYLNDLFNFICNKFFLCQITHQISFLV